MDGRELAEELEPDCHPPVSFVRCVFVYVLGMLGLALLGATCGAVCGLTCGVYERAKALTEGL